MQDNKNINLYKYDIESLLKLDFKSMVFKKTHIVYNKDVDLNTFKFKKDSIIVFFINCNVIGEVPSFITELHLLYSSIKAEIYTPLKMYSKDSYLELQQTSAHTSITTINSFLNMKMSNFSNCQIDNSEKCTTLISSLGMSSFFINNLGSLEMDLINFSRGIVKTSFEFKYLIQDFATILDRNKKHVYLNPHKNIKVKLKRK